MLVIAAISFLIGIVGWLSNANSATAIGGIFISLVLVGIFFATRQQLLALASAGATIRVNAGGMKAEMVTAFVDRVELAKNARYFVRQTAV